MRILMSLLIAVFLMGGQAVAKTPDGETPAEEDVCAAEEGAAYGLCNAYCEAMDCEEVAHNGRLATACKRVAANYFKIEGKAITCGQETPVYECDEYTGGNFSIFLNHLTEKWNNEESGTCNTSRSRILTYVNLDYTKIIDVTLYTTSPTCDPDEAIIATIAYNDSVNSNYSWIYFKQRTNYTAAEIYQIYDICQAELISFMESMQ